MAKVTIFPSSFFTVRTRFASPILTDSFPNNAPDELSKRGNVPEIFITSASTRICSCVHPPSTPMETRIAAIIFTIELLGFTADYWLHLCIYRSSCQDTDTDGVHSYWRMKESALGGFCS